MDEIRVTCKGADMVPIKQLSNFQGNLKTLAEAEYTKLRTSIENHGFSFPIAIWKDHGDYKIIDGHQSLYTVKKMLADGWKLANDKLPVDTIEAKDEKEARQKILLRSSQYGKMTYDSLYDFLKGSDLTLNDLESEMDIPQIDLETFQAGWFNEFADARNQFPELIQKFQHERGKATENENWFYIEYYTDQKRWEELTLLLEKWMLGKSKHEVDPDLFYKAIKQYLMEPRDEPKPKPSRRKN